MRHVKRLSVGLITVLSVGVVLVPGASASSFLAEQTGKLAANSFGSQLLSIGGVTVTCNAMSALNSYALSLRALTLALTVEYEECTAFGLPVKATLASYLFSADNNLVRLLNSVTLTATGCTIILESAKNQSLKTVKYVTSGKMILIDSQIAGITGTGSGSVCNFGQVSNGTYVGTLLAVVEGGTLRWDP